MPDALWVFGYGSLIWNPEFPVAEARIARLSGWHRSFCLRSIHHRGTVSDPGLVLALDAAAGAHCDGVAFRVRRGAEQATISALRERELISSAYLERRLSVEFVSDQPVGGRVEALAFVIDADHVQYCGGLALEQQAQVIAAAHGGRGSNRDYLFATADHLATLGIADDDLTWLSNRVRSL